MDKKSIIGWSIVGSILILAIVIGFKSAIIKIDVPSFLGAAGDSFSSKRLCAKVVATGTTTLVSCYNGDTRDRIIGTGFYAFNSLPKGQINTTPPAQLTLTVSTSTGAFVADSSNYVVNTTIATSSVNLFNASSTSATTPLTDTRWIWPAGTYLNFTLNATTSASGVVGVEYYSQ